MSRRIQGGAEWETERDLFAYSTYGYYGVTDALSYGAGDWCYFNGGTVGNGWWGGPAVYSKNIQSLTEFYAKADVYIDAMPSSAGTTYDAFFQTASTSNSTTPIFAPCIYNNSGTLYLRVEINNGAIVETPINLGIGLQEWFRFEVHFSSVPADGGEILEFKVNGTTVYSRTDLTFSTKQPYVNLSQPEYSGLQTSYLRNQTGSSATMRTYFDNLAINDGSTSYNNSWIGEEYVLMFGTTNTSTNSFPYDSLTSISRTAAGSTYYKLSVSGINSYDTVNAVMPVVMARETEAGTSAFYVGIKTPQSDAFPNVTTAEEAGSNTSSTDEAFRQPAVNWGEMGADKNINDTWIGVGTDNSVDVRISAIMGTVAYTPGTPPPGGMLGMFF